jgi:transcription antitermination protein NusB
MPARTKARKRALDVLYEADLMSLDPIATLRIRLAQADPPVPDYAVELIEGVVAHLAELDRLIASLSESWTMARMPAVDRNVLRLGAYEILHRPDVPEGVAVSEAVELVGRLSTDESAAFVNGVLAKIVQLRPPIVSGGVSESAGSDGLDGSARLG